jgi:hypothetical protein
MPTGYTYCVENGSVTEFPEFAMRCARAFGALVELRDEPLDAPIPERLSSSTYYADRVTAEQRRLEKLESMSAADVAAAYEDHFLKVTQVHEQMRKERAEQNARYDAMLAKVKAWTPPTSEHEGLKAFMVEQIGISRHDWVIELPKREEPQMWHKQEIEDCRASALRCSEESRKEAERGSGRNEWVRQLRESLESV